MRMLPPGNDVETGAFVGPPPKMVPPPQPKTWFPWMVPLIFLVNVGMFVYTMYVNNCPENTGADRCVLYQYLKRFSFQPLNENYVLGPSLNTLEKLGAIDKDEIVNHGQGWRLFSSFWLHAGVAHLLSNMFGLIFIGIQLEKEFGFLRILPLYVLAGLGGSLLSAIYTEGKISVGASGALLGLLGAMLSDLITNWTIYTNKCAAVSTLVVIIALNLALGFIPRVDSYAHTGGFLSGFLLGFVLLVRPQYGYVSRKYISQGFNGKHKKSKYMCYQYFLWITALIILIIGYIWGFFKLFDPKSKIAEGIPEKF